MRKTQRLTEPTSNQKWNLGERTSPTDIKGSKAAMEQVD